MQMCLKLIYDTMIVCTFILSCFVCIADVSPFSLPFFDNLSIFFYHFTKSVDNPVDTFIVTQISQNLACQKRRITYNNSTVSKVQFRSLYVPLEHLKNKHISV